MLISQGDAEQLGQGMDLSPPDGAGWTVDQIRSLPERAPLGAVLPRMRDSNDVSTIASGGPTQGATQRLLFMAGLGEDDAGEVDDFGISAGAAAAISAIVAAATATAAGVTAGISAAQKDKRAEIQEARDAGASAAEIKEIRDRWAGKIKGMRKKRRSLKKCERRRTRKIKRLRRQGKPIPDSLRYDCGHEKRRRKVQEKLPPAEVLRRIHAGTTMASDMLQRAGMMAQEVDQGYAVDPVTGKPVTHQVQQMAPVEPLSFPPQHPIPGMAPLPWWRKPGPASVPLGVYAAGAGLLGLGLVFGRGRRR